MFLEITDPKVIDLSYSRDRVRLRVGESITEGRFWLNLTFYNKEDLIKFRDKINETIEKRDKVQVSF